MSDTLQFLFLMEGPLDGWSPAIRSHTGKIFPGMNHAMAARDTLKQEYGGDLELMAKYFRMPNGTMEGFITPDGGFMSREDAFEVWRDHGAYLEPREDNKLDSSDVLTYEMEKEGHDFAKNR